MATDKTNQFIMFGCWNNLNDGKGGLEDTMASLKDFLQKTPVDFIAVAGDNYYPGKDKKKDKDKDKDKDKKKEKGDKKEEKGDKKKGDDDKKEDKTKQIIPENLLRGFSLLPDNIPIKMILGNHDLDTNKVNDTTYKIGDVPEEPGTCAILDLEKRAVENTPNIDFDLMHSIVMGNALVLMIDTSMYDPDDSSKFIPCYIKQDPTFRTLTPYETIIERQHLFIKTELINHPNVRHLIIIGHHPITGVKCKQGKGDCSKSENPLIEPFPLFIKELKFIGNMVPNLPITYLCADLHLYQMGTVIITSGRRLIVIHQYIVGTGGTELDPVIQKAEVRYETNELVYVIEPIPPPPYDHGFLRCDCSNGQPTFMFIQTNFDHGGTKKRKGLKNKRGTRKLKRSKQKRKKQRSIYHYK